MPELCCVSHLICPWFKSPIIIQSPLLTSLIALCIFSLFCLFILGQRYTTPMVTGVCHVSSLHHHCNLLRPVTVLRMLGILSLMYSNTPPPLIFFHILCFINIT